MVETFNLQRAGARIALEAAQKVGEYEIINTQLAMQDSFKQQMDQAATDLKTARNIFAASVSFNNTIATVYEARINRRGLGFVLPVDIEELVALRNNLIYADTMGLFEDQLYSTNYTHDSTHNPSEFLTELGMHIEDDYNTQ